MPLKKHLGPLHVFSISAGAMISSGLFILPGLAHAQAGPAVTLSYLIAALLAAAGMLSIAELSTAMPKAGGDYFFTTRTLGPAVGTIAGLLTWLSISLKSAFALIGMSAFTAAFLRLDIRLIGIGLCLLFTLLNLKGVQAAGRVQVGLVAGLMALMGLYIAAGLRTVNIQHLSPFAPHGFDAVFATAGFVFVSFGGLLKTASLSEEVCNPGRTIPLGLISSLLVTGLLYVLMVFVTSGTVPAAILDGSLQPITEGARISIGAGGAAAMSVAALLAFTSTANAGILAASRYLLAMSRDRLLPEQLGRIDPKRGVPVAATAVTAAVISAALFLDLDALIKAASSVLILTYILANLSLIILRESRILHYRPLFQAPLYPWLPGAGCIGCLLLLAEMGVRIWIQTGLLIAAGGFIYWFYGRIKAERDCALLHLLARITAREIDAGNLEEELKAIIRERDDLIADRLDRLIEDSLLLDLEKASPDELFRTAARQMAGPLQVNETWLYEKLIAREKDGSTAISPEVAIPHIILDGEDRFRILLVRCRKGIRFSDEAPSVKAVFVLAGTRDRRTLHLRCLAGIAQIVQDGQFMPQWLAARQPAALRDVVLLGRRQRGA